MRRETEGRCVQACTYVTVGYVHRDVGGEVEVDGVCFLRIDLLAENKK